MAITSIKRDFSDEPNIVRMISTDNLTTIATAGYLTAQAENIAIINNGPFEWNISDMVLVYASNGWDFYTISSDFTSLNSFADIAAVEFIGSPIIGDLPKINDLNGNITDSGIAANKVLQSSFATPDVNANIISLTLSSITNANITAGTNLFTPASGKSYLLVGGYLNVDTSFSGGSNNSDLNFTIASLDTGPTVITASHTQLQAAAQSYAFGQTGFIFSGKNIAITSTNNLFIKANPSSDYTAGSASGLLLLLRTA